MNLAGVLIQGLVMYGPSWYKMAVELFQKPEPTKDDFLALLKFASQKSYDDYIAEARARVLPPPPGV